MQTGQTWIVLLCLHLDGITVYQRRSRISAHVAEGEMMQTDGDKLRLLAEWSDLKYPSDKNPEVQDDLRRIAKRLDALDLKKNTTNKDTCTCEIHDKVYYGCRCKETI